MPQSRKSRIKVNKERLWQHLRVLCEEIGPRLSGTPGDERAVEYMAGHMRRCGAEVEVQDYACPAWEHGLTELALIGPGGPERLPAVAQTFTRGCDVEAELAGVGSQEELELAPGLDGKVLVFHGRIVSNLTADRNPLLLAAEERRAAALIVVSPREAVATKFIRDPFLQVPAAAVADSVGRRLLASDGRRLRLRISARRYDSTGHNVIGRLRGEEPGHIAVAAHYDSAADVPGASDNASGTAVLLELCELFGAAARPRLGIHFIAYGAEEYGRSGHGCLGPVEYVRRHPEEVAQARAVIEPDFVGTAALPARVTVMGFTGSQKDELLAVLARFPRCQVTVRPEGEKVGTTFDLTGAPALLFVNEFEKAPIHTAQDSINLLSPEEMAYAAEVEAAVLQHLSGSRVSA